MTRAAPEFWVAMLLLAIFAFRLRLLPSSGTSPAGVIYESELDCDDNPQYDYALKKPPADIKQYPAPHHASLSRKGEQPEPLSPLSSLT